MRPVASHECLESEEAHQGEPSVLWIHHPSVGRCSGCTMQDRSFGGGILASNDGIAQLFSDGDEIEVGTSTSHRYARNCHRIQGIEATRYAVSVVELEGRYGPRDDPSL